jgi:NAD(P)-dependent dehydrogenase (short-subunit alcohol dehydrogenase family)
MYPELQGRRVLVTGASRGIGFSVARAFAAAGSLTFVLAETRQITEAAAQLQEAASRPVTAIQCDVTDRAALTSGIRAIGALDVVVANAGTGDITPVDDPSEEIDDLFERLVRINLVGAYNTVRAALPLLSAGGRIIFTSSVHGQSIAPPRMGGYTASKGGLEALMRTLARELGPRGINVNAVAPGMVATELTLRAVRKLFGAQIGSDAGISEDQMIERLNSGQAIHHEPVSADRLARAYLFLASDAGSAITGQSINVDHGLCMN